MDRPKDRAGTESDGEGEHVVVRQRAYPHLGAGRRLEEAAAALWATKRNMTVSKEEKTKK